MPNEIQFRVIVGSYEHSLLCLSARIPLTENDKDIRKPHFQTIFHFQAHSLSIRSIDIAKRYLVTGSNDEHIRIYDLQKRKELGTLLQHQGSITKLLFSNELLNDNNKKEEDDEENISKDETITYPSHKSGKWLLSGSEDGNIIIWRTKDWEKFGVLKGHKGAVNDISIHPTGRVAISVGVDQTVRLWNLMTAKKASSLKLRGTYTRGQEATFVKFNLSGDFFVVGFRDRLMFWNTREAKLINLLGTNKLTIMDIKFVKLDDNNEYLIIAFSNGSINLYNFNLSLFEIDDVKNIDGGNLVNIREPDFKLLGHSSRVKGISIYQEINDGKQFNFMTSISSDGQIVIWNLDTKIMDQVAVYTTGERLNVVTTIQESVEKADTMKPIYNPELDDKLNDIATDSEYESDGESLSHIMKGRKKKLSKKKQKQERKKLLKVEIES